jgi:Transcriptional regulators of sugar metabolism
MLKNERLDQINDLIRRNGSVEVAALCRLFGVSDMTIRRDLEMLEKNNLAVRSRGGAKALSDNVLSENAYEIRMTKNLREKEAIAELALTLINDGDKVFFDSSTTVFCLAKILRHQQNFLVVTDTLPTAIEANSRKSVKVICLGGEIKKNTNSCSSLFAEQMLETLNFTTVFMSAPIVSADGNISISSISELSIKKKVLDKAQKKVFLFDSSKLKTPDFISLCHISQFDVVITDSGIDKGFVDACSDWGVNLLVADI